MSLINRMLTDLEERRGGNLRNVDHALDGLRPTSGGPPKPRPRIRRVNAAAIAVIAVLAALSTYLFLRVDAAVAPPPAVTETAARSDSALAPAAAQATSQPPAVTPPAAATGEQSVAVVLGDVPRKAATDGPQPAAPVTPAEEPAPMPEAMEEAIAATPPPPAVATPKPMLSQPSTEEHHEPLVNTSPKSDARRSGNRKAERSTAANSTNPAPATQAEGESSFFLADAAPPTGAADRAIVMLEDGDTEGAEAMLREGLATAPGDTSMARVLGHILLARNDAAGAVQALRPAAPTLESDPDYHALLAAAEQRSGAHGPAIRRYRELLRLQPANGAWLAGLGISLQASGDAPGAAEAFLKALADPALPPPLHDFAMQQAMQIKERQP
jgi:MSHA biogenesis protein MshN